MTFAIPISRLPLKTAVLPTLRSTSSGSSLSCVRYLSAATQTQQSIPPAASISGLGNAVAAESSVPSETAEAMRLRAIKLYKELHRLGRDYPDPEYGFNRRLRRAYEKNSKTTDPAALAKQLELAEHIKKEVLALISLKKFRHLRRSYHANEGPR